MSIPALNFSVILPETVIVVTALLVMLIDVMGRAITPSSQLRRLLIAILALVGLLTAAGITAFGLGGPVTDMQNVLVNDDLSRYLNLVVLLAAVLGVLLAWDYLTHFTDMIGEFYALFLLAVAGMMFMGKSVELITLFVSLEILSVGLYILTGFHRGQLAGGEGALKYFLLGAFSSGFFLYGAAMLYGATGTTYLSEIAALAPDGFFVYAGLALLLVGFGFKLALVPFHMWAPDAYQGAPTPVTAFMSVATKAAAFVALFRVLQTTVSIPGETWGWALAILSLLTMTLGNLAALRQSSLKRMLAYSSIAHAGYMLVGLVAGTEAGLNAVLFYLFAYAFMNIGAFAVASLLEPAQFDAAQDAPVSSANGLFTRKPLLAMAMAIFLLSLAGIPPLAGFFGKLYLFAAAVESGWVWLAIAGLINSVISAYYYLRVTVSMYMVEPSSESHLRMPLPDSAVIAITVAVLGTILFGIFGSAWFTTLQDVTVALLIP